MVFLSLVACGTPWTLDGGWGGRSVCEDDDVLDVEAIFDADPETGVVDGLFVIDLPLDLGLLGEIVTVQRATIEDGVLTLSDGEVDVGGHLARDPSYTNGETREYTFTLGGAEGDETLEGTLDRVNGEGQVLLACDLELDRLHEP
ncbi:MAG: hypothetical protein KC656_02325 [Myxococcales bacterium]|nr:hypothetical protein [Myxococcales bacterium]MCB9671213.1 hypothetical protein [Alphaproteobacteria bacterium]